MLSVTQLMMRPTEIVGTADQIHSRLQGLQTLGGMPTFARQSSQTFPHGSIEAFNQGRIELLASSRQCEQLLCFLKRSPGDLAGNFHHPLLFRVLDHGSDTQLRPYGQTCSSWSCFLLYFFSRIPVECSSDTRSTRLYTPEALARIDNRREPVGVTDRPGLDLDACSPLLPSLNDSSHR